MTVTDMQIETMYYSGTNIPLGIRATTLTGECVLSVWDGLGHILTSDSYNPRNIPRNSREYWDEVAKYWKPYEGLRPLFQKWVASGGLAFMPPDMDNLTEYPFPDWLKLQLEKRFGEPIKPYRGCMLQVNHYSCTGVYVTGVVHTIITWEQWEQLLQYTEQQR